MRPKTLLVGWEAADWTFLLPFAKQEKLPALAEIGLGGVGGELQTLPPYDSTVLWNTLVTGKRPWRHGVHGAVRVDDQGQLRPTASLDRRVATLWDMASAAGLRSLVIGGPASYPALPLNGVAVSDAFFQGVPGGAQAAAPTIPQSVWPPELAADLTDLRVGPNSLEQEILQMLVPGINQALVERDPRLVRLAVATANLYSVHNVAASLVETEPWDFAAVYFPFIGDVLRDFSSFLAPRQSTVPLAAFGRYQGVVEAACRLQDLLLRDLLTAAGPGTRVFVVSPHGHRHVPADPTSPPLPDEQAARNRRNGIFAAHGPGIRPQAGILSGASVLDVAPTILRLLGLPVGDDLDGRVLNEILTGDVQARTEHIPSWGSRVEGVENPSVEGKSILSDAAKAVRVQNGWNEGTDLLDAGLAAQALPLLEQAAWSQPEAAHTNFWLAMCQAKLGLADEAQTTASLLDDLGPAQPAAERLRSILSLEAGKSDRAIEHLSAALAAGKPDQPGDLPVLKAMALQQSGKWLEAAEILQVEAASNPTAEVWQGIVRCYLALGRARAAVAAARQYLRAAAHLLQTRLLLARCLVKNGETAEGWNTLLEARQMRPGAPEILATARQLFPDRKEEWGTWAPEEKPDGKSGLPDTAEVRAGTDRRRNAWEEMLAAKRSQVSPDVPPSPGGTPPEPLAVAVDGKPYLYRAPWPDEENRARAILGNLPTIAKKTVLRVWETPSPRRFAGVAAWGPPLENETEAMVSFQFRPGFCEPALVEALLRPLFAEMQAAGYSQVRVLASRRVGWEAVLQRFSLACVKSDEVWIGDAERAHQTLMVKLGHWEKEIPPDVRVRDVTEADWDFITHDCAALEYMGSGNLERTRHEFAGDISSIVESDAGREGVLLATRIGTAAVLEFFGKSRTSHRFSPWVTQLSFRRFFRRDPPHAIDQVFATIDLHKGEAGSAMLRRLGSSQTVQTVHHFTGELSL